MNRLLLLAVSIVTFISLGLAANAVAKQRNGHWIWQEQDGPANTWVAFRKEFDLDQVPEAVAANISTDTKYWLWINGQPVLFEGGLARGPFRDGIYYDQVDIKPFLKRGKNSVAILVWYWGKTAKTHEDSGKGGLLFSADLGKSILASDSTWRQKVHPAYDPKSKGLHRSANRPNAMDVKYDARKALGDWTDKAWYSPDYSMDETWKPATEKGNADSLPWGKLVKRPIPLWNDRGLADYESLRIENDQITLPFKNKGNKPVTVFAKLPDNKQITPYLKVNSGGGKTIRIGTDNKFNLINAQYTTRRGAQSFETYSWMNGHAVKYTVPPGVEILELKYRWTGLGEIEGTFECSDPYFQRLWSMAANTLYICSRDSYMDCPDRERGLWIGDVADQTGAVFYTLGDPGRLLLKKGIDNTIAYQDSDIIQGLAPGFGDYRGKSSELTAQSLQYIDQGIWRYYFNTGDKSTLANAYPSVFAYLKLWNMKPSGLPEIRKGYASWVDWGTNPDRQPVEICWYYIALNAAKKMAIELEQVDDIRWYDSRIDSIQKKFDSAFWRDGHYGSAGAVKDERVSALAILSGLADESRWPALLENVLTTQYNASPHMEWIVEEAIMLTGDHAAALKRMRDRYLSQVDDENLTTLCEKFGKRRGTPNHAWNAPNYVLSRYVAGIAADDVAWKTYHVLPNLAHMTAVKQVVPSVKGDISVDIKLADNTFTMELISPQGTSALVGIPKASIAAKTIQVNGTLVWQDDAIADAIPGISWHSEDDQYIKFNVAPGEWIFSAKSAGRTMLFNGKDLEGWDITLEKPAANVFTAQDGTLHVTGMPFGYIQTQKSYANYRLHVEWRWVDAPPATGKKRNSGVFLHATGKDKLWPACVEAQLRENNAGFMIFVDESTCDQIEQPKEGKNAAKKFIDIQKEDNRFRMFKRDQGVEEKPVGQWNTYDILCKGDTISLSVNGKQANKATGCVPSAGKIGFQSEGGQLELRNIYIEPVE